MTCTLAAPCHVQAVASSRPWGHWSHVLRGSSPMSPSVPPQVLHTSSQQQTRWNRDSMSIEHPTDAIKHLGQLSSSHIYVHVQQQITGNMIPLDSSTQTVQVSSTAWKHWKLMERTNNDQLHSCNFIAELKSALQWLKLFTFFVHHSFHTVQVISHKGMTIKHVFQVSVKKLSIPVPNSRSYLDCLLFFRTWSSECQGMLHHSRIQRRVNHCLWSQWH